MGYELLGVYDVIQDDRHLGLNTFDVKYDVSKHFITVRKHFVLFSPKKAKNAF